MSMKNALPERGTYRPFTEAEWAAIGVPWGTLESFMRCVLTSYLVDHNDGFYPRSSDDAD
jgi:hypothetical protein